MKITAIIPVLDDASRLDVGLTSLDETIIVDGGSQDESVEVAVRLGARVLLAPRGRAHQMNAGARAATGDVLLFLHADTRLPASAGFAIRRAVLGGAIGGCFETVFDARNWLLRVGDFWRNLRARFLNEFYGDQAIYVRRDVFERLGGFRELDVMEDYDFCLRLRRAGRLEFIARRAVTSARKFLRNGIVRTWVLHQGHKWRFFAGRCRSRRAAESDRGEGCPGSGSPRVPTASSMATAGNTASTTS